MLLYYVTDRHGFAGNQTEQCASLLERIGLAARVGVDYIQLREKDLAPRQLEQLARQAMRTVRKHSRLTQLLINGRSDIALASGADGVHLPSGELPASEIRALWARNGRSTPVISVAAHSLSEVRYAEAYGANLTLLAPIFEKIQTASPAVGLEVLRAACLEDVRPDHTEAPSHNPLPVLALGGVTLANARACILAGAAGIAGIRLFQHGDIAHTVHTLRTLQPAA